MTVSQIDARSADSQESRNEVIARRVRELMAGRRLHGKDMALVLGISQPAFSRRATGEIEFLPSQLERIAHVLQVNEAYLYGFTDDRSRSLEGAASGSVHPLGLEPRTR